MRGSDSELLLARPALAGPSSGGPLEDRASTRRRDSRAGWIAWVMAAAIMIEEVVLGGDGRLPAMAAACAQILLAGVAVVLLWPRSWVTTAMAPVLLSRLAALAWLTLPLAIPAIGAGQGFVSGGVPMAFARDAGLVACLFTGILVGARRRAAERAVTGLLVLGLAWVGLALALDIVGPVGIWSQVAAPHRGRLLGTQRNANVAGALMAVLAILGFLRAIELPRAVARRSAPRLGEWLRWSLGASVVALAGLGVVLSQSRTAAVAAVLGMVGLVAAVRRRRRARFALQDFRAVETLSFIGDGAASRMRALVGLGIVGAAAWLAVFAALRGAVPGPLANLGQRFAALLPALADHGRATLDYLSLSFERPWFGYGAGAFPAVNLAHLSPETAVERWDFGAAHSFLVQDALEAGWPHVLFGLGAAVAGLRLLLGPRAREARDPATLALALALATLVVAGLVDIALDFPAHAALANWLGGLLVGRAIRARHEHARLAAALAAQV